MHSNRNIVVNSHEALSLGVHFETRKFKYLRIRTLAKKYSKCAEAENKRTILHCVDRHFYIPHFPQIESTTIENVGKLSISPMEK